MTTPYRKYKGLVIADPVGEYGAMLGVDPTIQMWLTLAVIAAGVILYAWEKHPMELISLMTLGALLLLFYFLPYESPGGQKVTTAALLAGFADPALITVIALLVVAQGLVQTGALELPIRYLLQYVGNHPSLTISAILICVTFISAFLNDTPVVVIFIPIFAVLADKLGRAPSKVMLPLSYAAILGGMTTLIGSSTNLLAAGAFERLGGTPIGFFDITPVGAVIAAAGLVYVLLVVPRLLPDRRSLVGSFSASTGKQFIVQIDVTQGSLLEGKRAVAGMFTDLSNMTVRLVRRGEATFLPPFEDVVLQAGDAVVVAATRKALTEALASNPRLLEGVIEETSNSNGNDHDLKRAGDRILAEVIVAPASRMDGRTLDQTGFQETSGCAVLGIQRRSRMLRASMNEIRLEAGDVLLLLGKQRNVTSLRNNRDVILLEWSATDLPERRHALIAVGIFITVVALAAANIMPIAITSLIGVAAMIMTGCLNVRQAARAVDRRIFLLVGAALAMGTAMEHTGGAAYLAGMLANILNGHSPAVILSAFFLLVAIVTNVLSNNATAVLFTPIAANLARQVGIDPAIFVTAVIFAANCSFATPMGYQTNLLVMGPGHYKFADYTRTGLPLMLIVWLTYSLYAPWYYGL